MWYYNMYMIDVNGRLFYSPGYVSTSKTGKTSKRSVQIIRTWSDYNVLGSSVRSVLVTKFSYPRDNLSLPARTAFN